MCFNIILKSVNYFMLMVCIVITLLYANELQTPRKTQILRVSFSRFSVEYLILAYSFLALKLLFQLLILLLLDFLKYIFFYFILWTKVYSQAVVFANVMNFPSSLSKYVPRIRVMYNVTLFASHVLSFVSIQLNSRLDDTKFSDFKFLLI